MRTSHYCGDYTALTTTKWGAKIYVDTRDTSLAPHIMIEGDWEPWVTSAIATVLQKHPGCTFIDVGANVGWYTLLAAGLGAGHIYAFEPNPRMVALLQKTIAVNGLRDRVTLTEAACGAEQDLMELVLDPEEAGGAHVERMLSSLGGHSPTCDVVRLDDVVKARHKDGVLTQVIVKIDVEGFEPQVLLGADRLLGLKPTLFIEHHHSVLHQGMFTVLQNEGYALQHVQHTGHPGAPLTVEQVMGIEEAETIMCTPKGRR